MLTTQKPQILQVKSDDAEDDDEDKDEKDANVDANVDERKDNGMTPNDEIVVKDSVTFKSSMKQVSFLKRVWKRFKNYRGIYVTAVIHCADVITDYLVLCQYIFFAIDELFYDKQYENINYPVVAVFSFLAILLSRLLSCYYINIFTHNKCDLFLNMFDLYIFKEILASHQTGWFS